MRNKWKILRWKNFGVKYLPLKNKHPKKIFTPALVFHVHVHVYHVHIHCVHVHRVYVHHVHVHHVHVHNVRVHNVKLYNIWCLT